MGVLYLVRHGQARAQAYGAGAWAQAEGGLTDLGAEQARRAGSALAARVGRIDHAVSGDLARQRETLARIIDEQSDIIEPAIDARWNEYDIDSILGDRERTENATERGFQAQLDGALSDWIARIAVGSETYAQYRQRADDAFDDLIAHAGSGKTVVAVSSAGTIAAVVARLWGIDDERWLAIARTMINTSVTKILIGSSGASVVSINDHAHVDHADDRRLMTFR
ncbi:histidine phosphatase family protein [Williamsia sp.]|uniref:histidine phosphatase family protein n=1 Tax=Williamsia sp. TaxID=1872085 RepID=UPI001A18AAF4|nr:histidine phosphatase family protein [Williamsia sp.]MBJ7289489.1 histidine phosphatase family protein [Williamsia sp.]